MQSESFDISYLITEIDNLLILVKNWNIVDKTHQYKRLKICIVFLKAVCFAFSKEITNGTKTQADFDKFGKKLIKILYDAFELVNNFKIDNMILINFNDNISNLINSLI